MVDNMSHRRQPKEWVAVLRGLVIVLHVVMLIALPLLWLHSFDLQMFIGWRERTVRVWQRPDGDGRLQEVCDLEDDMQGLFIGEGALAVGRCHHHKRGGDTRNERLWPCSGFGYSVDDERLATCNGLDFPWSLLGCHIGRIKTFFSKPDNETFASRFRISLLWFVMGPAAWPAYTGLRCILANRRADARWRKGLCVECGYDLRASPDRCPECGRSVQRHAH